MSAWLQLAAALYLAAAVAGGAGLVLRAPRGVRGSLWLLAGAALAHGLSFVALHRLDPTPQLTDVPLAVSLMALMVVLAFFALAWRARLAGLVVLVAPLAFLGAFFAAVRVPAPPGAALVGGGWPHAHVLLASAGFALLAVAALAGIFFLLENRRLKHRRAAAGGGGVRLPSLEALDGVNAVALAVGFSLLSLGVVTGMLWMHAERGRAFGGTPHETWTLVAWGVYALLNGARFGARQGGRRAAQSAVVGFLFLLVAVVGLRVVA